MHHRFIRLILEVTLPALVKVIRGPTLHLLQFLCIRPDLHARFDAVRR